MSTQPKDGGPAFPGTHMEYVRGFGAHAPAMPSEVAHRGMSLRDYFAAKAMQGYVVRGGGESETFDARVSVWACEMADAMLAQREKAAQP